MEKYNSIYIIAGGYVSPAFLQSKIREAKDEKPFIFAADRGLEVLKKIGIVPDLMLGDFDSASSEVVDYFRGLSVEEIKLNPIKDDTDMEAAIRESLRRFPGVPITIFGATGTRLDHVLANVNLLALGLLDDGVNTPITILDEHNKIYLLESGKEAVISKEKQHGKYFSLLNYTDNVHGLRITGAAYNVGDENGGIDFVRGISRGVSNEVAGEKARITIEDGILIVIESRD